MYRNLRACVNDLEQSGQLLRLNFEVDPHLELASIQRRALANKSPALLFCNVKGTKFPMLANLFGTRDRLRYIFRDTLRQVEKLFNLAADPGDAIHHFYHYLGLPFKLLHCLPRKVNNGPVRAMTCKMADLPHLVSWPGDGGAFITLPEVYTEQPGKAGWFGSNLGMYRVQLSGNDYATNEVGMHYQIQRGIGYHHAEALKRGENLPVNIFVGGPPAMTLASILPSPEGIPEIAFAGLLAGFRIPMIATGDLPILAEADFCISGQIAPYVKPEGPFGDHLGYYSMVHDFPVLKIDNIYHRPDAIWPFTSVGRPPQEDTMFGEIIHELTGPLISRMFSGVKEIHAVDAAGVHPLLLAVGQERYTPWISKAERIPQELLTCGLSLLGSTQTALSKFVMLAAAEDAPALSTHNIPDFFRHILERTRFDRDLHFITKTTMDTLDYSGISLNQGSKLLWTVAGEQIRQLGHSLDCPGSSIPIPPGFGPIRVIQPDGPGILVVQAPPNTSRREAQAQDIPEFAKYLQNWPAREAWPLIVLVDDANFASANWDNFLWVAFTRADPATDIHGVASFTTNKHWGCVAPLILDSRSKPHHAQTLEPDPDIERRIDRLAAPGGLLHGIC